MFEYWWGLPCVLQGHSGLDGAKGESGAAGAKVSGRKAPVCCHCCLLVFNLHFLFPFRARLALLGRMGLLDQWWATVQLNTIVIYCVSYNEWSPVAVAGPSWSAWWERASWRCWCCSEWTFSTNVSLQLPQCTPETFLLPPQGARGNDGLPGPAGPPVRIWYSQSVSNSSSWLFLLLLYYLLWQSLNLDMEVSLSSTGARWSSWSSWFPRISRSQGLCYF